MPDPGPSGPTRPPTIDWRVVEVVDETPDARTFVLAPADGGEPPAYRPGQFLTVKVSSDRPEGCARNYSLCSAPGLDDHLAVTVKRTVGGYASNLLNDTVAVGDTITTLRPAGAFTPTTLDEDLVLVAGGSGVTPILSIARSVLERGRGRVALLYANRDERSVIFAGALRDLVAANPERFTVHHWLESVQGVPSVPAWRPLLRAYAGRRAFLCGPGPFMAMVREALHEVGMPSDRVTIEEFVSLTGDPFSAPVAAEGASVGTVEVTLDGQLTTIEWPSSARLLDVMLAAGLAAPWSCREGRCSTCACYLTQGSVELAHNEVLDAQDLRDGMILACQATPTSDRVAITFDA